MTCFGSDEKSVGFWLSEPSELSELSELSEPMANSQQLKAKSKIYIQTLK